MDAISGTIEDLYLGDIKILGK